MGPSPGHQKHPEHRVVDTPLQAHMSVEFDGQTLADSRDVVRVDEDGHPARFYFARDDVDMQRLQRSAKTTQCPFKGTASHFSLPRSGQPALDDAVWSYEDPYDEHHELASRVAFDESKSSGLLIRSLP